MGLFKIDGHIDFESYLGGKVHEEEERAIVAHITECMKCGLEVIRITLAEANAEEDPDSTMWGFTDEEWRATDNCPPADEKVLIRNTAVMTRHDHENKILYVINREISQRLDTKGVSDPKPRQCSFIVPQDELEELIEDLTNHLECLKRDAK